LLFITLLILEAVNDRAIIDLVLFLAAITYGPLLGLFTFGILMKNRTVSGWPVVLICILAPAICFLLNYLTTLKWDAPFLGGYKFGNELLIINGAITFAGLWIISKRTMPAHE
jgi:hypothetical protein